MSVMEKKGLAHIGVLLAALLALPSAAALIPGIVTNTLRKFFMTIPELWVFKFAFFIVVFAILYYAAYMVFRVKNEPRNKGTAVIISLTISLASSILLPAPFIDAMFKTYAYVVGIIILVGPIVGLTYIGSIFKAEDKKSYTRWQRGLRAGIFAIGSYFFGVIGESLPQLNFLGIRPDILRLDEVAIFISFIYLCLAIWNLILALWGGTGTEGAAGTQGSDWWKPKSSDDGGKGGSGDSGKGGTGDGGKGESGDGGKGRGAKSKNGIKENGLPEDSSLFDPTENAAVQVVVVDRDDNPINGARIVMKSTGIPRKLSLFRKNPYYTVIRGTTNADGFWPGMGQAREVPAGKYLLKAKKRGFWRSILTAGLKGTWSVKEDGIWLKPKGYYLIPLRLMRRGEKAETFQPKIQTVIIDNRGDQKIKNKPARGGGGGDISYPTSLLAGRIETESPKWEER